MRQETKARHNKLHNLTQAIAVKYKAPVADVGPSDVALSDLCVEHLLPTDDDSNVIMDYFNVIVRNIVIAC